MKKAISLLLIPFLAFSSYAEVQIVVLNVVDAGSNRVTYNYLCWLNSPNALANPSFVSQWKALGSSNGPTAQQISSLQSGTMIEQYGSLTVSSSTAISSVQNTLISDCRTRQTYINNIQGPGIYYGQTYNGSTWILQ